MLRNTFCHIPGIGLRTEKLLWSEGVLSWHDVLHGRLEGFPPRRVEIIQRTLEESLEALDRDDVRYFYNALPASEHWRLFGAFRHVAAYLDIETTGLGGPDDYVTVVGVHDGSRVHHYIQGENLGEFASDVRAFKLLVTYNGKRFDLPFIRAFMGVELPQPHVDLMFVLRAMGYRGGLKGCERQLGIDRGNLAGVDGFFAVLLWYEYLERGDRAALDTLLAYNAVDVINLETLAVLAYNMKLQETPFSRTHALPLPAPIPLPCQPDETLIARIRERYGG